MELTEYVKSGEHLPPELRDFHDAKLFFKWLVWEKVERRRAECEASGAVSSMMLEGLDFAKAQIFTIDYFLWFMAMFGYKLQRIRKNDMQFYDLSSAMREYSERLSKQQFDALSQALKTTKTEIEQSKGRQRSNR